MYSRPARGNHRASWMLVVASKSYSEYVLVHLLPFLIVKHAQAHEGLDFLKELRAGGLRRQLTIQERGEVNAKYREGGTVRGLEKEYRVGYKAIRHAIAGAMRGNRKGGKICRLCGGAKKWSKLRNGQPTLCRACEFARRRHLAAERVAKAQGPGKRNVFQEALDNPGAVSRRGFGSGYTKKDT